CKDRHVRIEVKDSETSSGPQDSNQFGDGGLSPRDVGEHRHTHDGIERSVGERHPKRIALAKLHAITKARLLGKLLGYGQQGGARIESDGQALSADPSGDLAGDGAAPATDVEDALAGGDVE